MTTVVNGIEQRIRRTGSGCWKYLLVLIFVPGLLILAGCSDERPADPSPPPATEAAVEASSPEVAIATEAATAEEPELPVHELVYEVEEQGSITGETRQSVVGGSTGTTVSAVAAQGFRFIGWSDGVATAERVDADVSGDLRVQALFAPVVYELAYLMEGNGRIDGPASQQVSHGEDAVPVTAVAEANHHFVEWSDGASDAQRHDRQVAAPVQVTARFAADQYQLVYSAAANGQISGAAKQSVAHGKEGQEVTAVAAEGHHFVRWSDGVTTARRLDTGVSESLAVTPEFAVNSYNVTYSAVDHGRVEGQAAQRVRHGEIAAPVTAVADGGYHFVTWSDGVTSAQRLDEDIRADLALTAQFALNTYVVGGVVQGLVAGTRLQIDNTAGEVLEISANGPFRFGQELREGAEYRVRVVAQPQVPNQICSLSGSEGVVGAEDVSGIVIECALRRYTVGGTVVGLPPQDRISLQNKGQERLSITADGPFVFPQELEDGSSYEVELVEPPQTSNWICDVHHPFGLLAGEDINNVEVVCYQQLLLEVEAGIGKVRLNWNHTDFSGVTFDLCQAREEIGAGVFADCRLLQGGNLRAGISTALVIDGLRNNQSYWFQVLARYASGHLTYSEPVSAVPYSGLNDTGVDWCADATSNREMSGVRGDKMAGCEVLAGSQPGQDAMFGRDQAALNRTLKKVGSGSAGFDFTRICRSGEAAGEGRCPPNPMIGKGFDNWGCNRDNVTGLMWEIKEDSGLRAAQHTYSWYQPDAAAHGGDAGVENGGNCSGSGCDTFSYIAAVNKELLCGVNNWRLPTRKELLSIVDNGRFNPALDVRQFPDAFSEYFWTSSPYADNPGTAWQVYFFYGEAIPAEKKQAKPLRLVSGETVTFGMDNQ